MLLQQTPLACFENFFLLLAIGRRFGERHFERPAEEAASVERVHGFHGVVALLKVDEGVIFDLLDALDRSVSLERLLQLLFCEVLRQVSNVQHFHFGHCVGVWLFLGIGPVNDDITAEDFHSARAQTAFG